MGVICILLGIITFLGFTGLGALAANAVLDYKVALSAAFVALEKVSNTTMIIVIVAAFAFIGLLIGLNLIMNGLTYNKVSKLYRMARGGRRK